MTGAMNESPPRDWAPVLHLGLGSLSILVPWTGWMSGMFDVGTVGVLPLMFFPAWLFLAGQPRGRLARQTAGASALPSIGLVGFGIPATRWASAPNSAIELLPAFVALLAAAAALSFVHGRSDPPPEGVPDDPKAWKPLTGRAIGSSLASGIVALMLALWVWDAGAEPFVDTGVAARFITYIQVVLTVGLAAFTTAWCRPSDGRSTVLTLLGGLAAAGLLTACVRGGMTLIVILMPEHGTLQSVQESLYVSASVIIPVVATVTWMLGRRPETLGIKGPPG